MKFRINGEPTEYEMLNTNVTFAEGRAVEKATGQTFASIAAAGEADQSVDVIQALLWVSMKRVNPTLLFSDLDDFDMSTVEEVEEEADVEVAEVSPLEQPSAIEETTSPAFA